MEMDLSILVYGNFYSPVLDGDDLCSRRSLRDATGSLRPGTLRIPTLVAELEQVDSPIVPINNLEPKNPIELHTWDYSGKAYPIYRTSPCLF